MRILAVVAFGIVLVLSSLAQGLHVDMPPRAQRRPKRMRCDHCQERDAWEVCTQCNLAWCIECMSEHTAHAEVW